MPYSLPQSPEGTSLFKIALPPEFYMLVHTTCWYRELILSSVGFENLKMAKKVSSANLLHKLQSFIKEDMMINYKRETEDAIDKNKRTRFPKHTDKSRRIFFRVYVKDISVFIKHLDSTKVIIKRIQVEVASTDLMRLTLEV